MAKPLEQPMQNMIDVQQELVPEEAFPDMATWVDFGRSIVHRQSPVQWEIGRWLVVGEQLFGRKAYREAELLTGYSRRTLYDMAWVVKQVSFRNEHLTWSHHKAIAHMSADEQLDWLDRARLGDLTVRDLRSSIRAHKLAPIRKCRPAECLENERLLVRLAKSRGVTLRAVKQAIFTEYLSRPEIVTELGAAERALRNLAAANRKSAREKWETWVTATVEDLLSRLQETETSCTDPGDFVAMWERETNRKFTRPVFVYAMRHTELRARYAGLSSEDFGLGLDPPVHVWTENEVTSIC